MKEGDLVKLATGGPLIKVTRIDDDYVMCSWMNNSGNHMSGSFPKHMLVLVSEN